MVVDKGGIYRLQEVRLFSAKELGVCVPECLVKNGNRNFSPDPRILRSDVDVKSSFLGSCLLSTSALLFS